MMRIVIEAAAFGQWQGAIYIDDEVRYTVRGVRPGCVARDLLNWVHYNLMEPTHNVTLEILNYD